MDNLQAKIRTTILFTTIAVSLLWSPELSLADFSGDRPPATRLPTYTGQVDLKMVVSAVGDPSSLNGSLSVSGIPIGAQIRAAFFYTTGWGNSSVNTVTLQFRGVSFGSIGPAAQDIDNAGTPTYNMFRQDVTSLVTGNGSYSYNVQGFFMHGYYAALAVVYEHSSLPSQQIIINDGSEAIQFASSTAVFDGVTATGSARLIIATTQDDAGSNETGEIIKFNGTSVGGPIDHNLGPYASVFEVPVTTLTGRNEVSITTQRDFLVWNNAILVVSTGCQINPEDVLLANDGTTVLAEYTPSSDLSLAAAASACGFNGFNWAQTVTVDPYPPRDASGQLLLVPYPDPPPGGYFGTPDNAWPFYWNQTELSIGACQFDGGVLPIQTHNKLRFCDTPAEPQLRLPQFLAFDTKLVGVLPNRSSQEVGIHFVWIDDFNGTVLGRSARKNTHPADPGSGTGGITIISINGVQQVRPTVSCAATPSVLWPPNGQSVLVDVSGTIVAGTSALRLDGTTYALVDEYGQVQRNDSITVGAAGSYSFKVSLIADRNGRDENGRTYTITISSRDTLGNRGSCSAVVTVPHDQRR